MSLFDMVGRLRGWPFLYLRITHVRLTHPR